MSSLSPIDSIDEFSECEEDGELISEIISLFQSFPSPVIIIHL